jgi:hypothetical protein
MGKTTSRAHSDRIAPPRQGGDRRRAFRRWEKRGTVILQLVATVSALFVKDGATSVAIPIAASIIF